MQETEKLFNVFFRAKPTLMLVELLNSSTNFYASALAKEVDCTYSHVVKILQQMETHELITVEKQGRLKLLTLTKKGEEIAKHMDKLSVLL